ncbi:MAG: hypothetical protein RL215_1148, partial [Planctomycetota bacterium]
QPGEGENDGDFFTAAFGEERDCGECEEPQSERSEPRRAAYEADRQQAESGQQCRVGARCHLRVPSCFRGIHQPTVQHPAAMAMGTVRACVAVSLSGPAAGPAGR